MKKAILAIIISAIAFAAVAAQITVTTSVQKIEPAAEIPGVPMVYSIHNTGSETIHFRANFPTNMLTSTNSIALASGEKYSCPLPGAGGVPNSGVAYIAIMTVSGTSTANIAFDAFR